MSVVDVASGATRLQTMLVRWFSIVCSPLCAMIAARAGPIPRTLVMLSALMEVHNQNLVIVRIEH